MRGAAAASEGDTGGGPSIGGARIRIRYGHVGVNPLSSTEIRVQKMTNRSNQLRRVLWPVALLYMIIWV